MENERLQILKMVQSGKITAEEASKLLLAVEDGSNGTAVASEAKWLKVRVTDLNTGRAKVNVNLPIALLDVGMNIGLKFVPEDVFGSSGGLDVKELVDAIRKGAMGKLVEVEDDDEGIRVEVTVE